MFACQNWTFNMRFQWLLQFFQWGGAATYRSGGSFPHPACCSLHQFRRAPLLLTLRCRLYPSPYVPHPQKRAGEPPHPHRQNPGDQVSTGQGRVTGSGSGCWRWDGSSQHVLLPPEMPLLSIRNRANVAPPGAVDGCFTCSSSSILHFCRKWFLIVHSLGPISRFHVNIVWVNNQNYKSFRKNIIIKSELARLLVCLVFCGSLYFLVNCLYLCNSWSYKQK